MQGYFLPPGSPGRLICARFPAAFLRVNLPADRAFPSYIYNERAIRKGGIAMRGGIISQKIA
ncbi:hypothetical protein B5F27_12870 [Faecalibacterium sp. An192]|nr:hypothetical protein B5F27_12870 [Faecalibacterium sp. An192]